MCIRDRSSASSTLGRLRVRSTFINVNGHAHYELLRLRRPLRWTFIVLYVGPPLVQKPSSAAPPSRATPSSHATPSSRATPDPFPSSSWTPSSSHCVSPSGTVSTPSRFSKSAFLRWTALRWTSAALLWSSAVVLSSSGSGNDENPNGISLRSPFYRTSAQGRFCGYCFFTVAIIYFICEDEQCRALFSTFHLPLHRYK